MNRLFRIVIIVLSVCYSQFLLSQNPKWDDPNSLPKWMTPEEEARKHEIGKDFVKTPPPTAPVRSIAEFERQKGVLIRWPLGIPFNLVRDLSNHTKVYTIVTSGNYNTALSDYTSNNVNLANCQWIIVSGTDTYWTRDYGPWYVAVGDDEIAIVDFKYNRPRPNDDQIPGVIANTQSIPLYAMDVEHTGGNYMGDGLGMAASSDLVYEENDYNLAWVNQQMFEYLGIENYHVTIDPLGGIKHIDCWAKFLDVDKILITEVPPSNSRYWAYEQVASYFASQISPYGTPYQVFRVYKSGSQAYTNSLILNDRVFVPISSSTPTEEDNAALNVYRQAMPGYTVTGYSGPWLQDDALHCRVKEMADLGMLSITHLPIHGSQPFQTEFEITANIIPYSGAALKTDSLFVIYSTDGVLFDTIPLINTVGHSFSANIPVAFGNDEITYYLFAADKSGRRENWPLIGKPGARSFQIDQSAGYTEVYQSQKSGTWDDSNTWEQQFADESWHNTLNVPAYSSSDVTTVFPQVASTNISAQNNRTTSHTVILPSGIQQNDLLLVFVTSPSSDNRTFTFPSGWTVLYNHNNSGLRSALIYKIAGSSEGSTIQFTTSGVSRTAHVSYCISAGTYVGVPVVGTMATSTGSTSPNPPNLISGFGNVKTLWIAATHSNMAFVSQRPTNYSNLFSIRNEGSTSAEHNAAIGTARRELEAASQDPGAFTLSTSARWSANTIAIRGATINFPAVSPEVTIVSGNTVTVVNDNSVGNVNVLAGGELTVNSGNTFSIVDNATLTIAGQANIDGSLNIADSDALALVIEDGGSLLGNVARAGTMKRTIPFNGWHMMAAPVNGMDIVGSDFAHASLSGFDLYYFKENVAQNSSDGLYYPWINIRHSGSTLNPNFDNKFMAGKGYLVSYESGNSWAENPFSFKGNLNAGSINVTIGHTAQNPASIRGWNLMGNPYPSAIDWSLASKSHFQEVWAHIYDPIYGGGGGYVAINSTIAPNQGFFVLANPGANGQTFSFTNSLRLHGGNFLKTETQQQQMVLKLSSTLFYDETTIIIEPQSDVNRDIYDAAKLFSWNSDMPQIFSNTSDQVNVAINSVPHISKDMEITLGLRIPANGQYTLSLSEIGGEFLTYPIYLKDLQTGTIHNFGNGSQYSFTSHEGLEQARFKLKFAEPTNIEEPLQIINVFYLNNHIHLDLGGNTTTNVIQVFDSSGRMVLLQSLGNSTNQTIPFYSEPGIYIVRVINQSGVFSKKVLVR